MKTIRIGHPVYHSDDSPLDFVLTHDCGYYSVSFEGHTILRDASLGDVISAMLYDVVASCAEAVGEDNAAGEPDE